MRTTALAATLLLALSAPAFGQQDPTLKCLETLAGKPELSPLEAKLGSLAGANKQSIAQLADRTKPTEDEKALISLWGTERMKCLDAGRDFRSRNVPPAVSTTVEDGQRRIINLLVKLYSGELTYGEFSVARNESSALTNSQLKQVTQQLQAQSQADQQRAFENQQRAEAQRQAEAQAQMQSGLQLLQMARPQPMPFAPMPFPQTTTCRSQWVLGQFQTVCN